jgi:hypothetical protein
MLIVSDIKHNDIVSPKIIGISPKVVKVHSLALAGVLIPIFGLASSLTALIKSGKAKEELALSNGSLEGYGLYKKAVVLGWLGVLSFFVNILLIIGLIWLVQNAPALLSEPAFQQFLQSSNSEVLNNVPANIDLKSLGLSDADIARLKEILPEDIDINNLTVSDILRIAEAYGIITE